MPVHDEYVEVSVRLPKDLRAELMAEAWREQLSLTEWIRHLLYERGKSSRISVRARETQT